MYRKKTPQTAGKDIFIKFGTIRIDINSLALLFLLSSQTLTYFVGEYGYLLLRGMQAGVYAVFMLNLLLNGEWKPAVCVLGGIVVVFGISWLIHPENRPALNEIRSSMFKQAMYFMMGYCCRDMQTTVKVLRVGAIINLVYLSYGIAIIKHFNTSDDYLVISGGLSWIAAFYLLVDRKQVRLKVPLLCYTLLLILLFGRRSTLVYLAVLMMVLMLRKWHGKLDAKKFLIILGSITLIVVIVVMYEEIIRLFANIAQALGINSRTINRMLEGEFSDLNGRDALYDLSFEMAKEKPLTGNGIGSVMARWVSTHKGMPNYSGCNSHNSVFEAMAEFGFIGAGIFVIIHTIIFIRLVKMELDVSHKTVLMIVAATGLIPTLVGGSYLTGSKYAAFMGIYLNTSYGIRQFNTIKQKD